MQGPEKLIQLLRVVATDSVARFQGRDQVSSSQNKSHGMSCMFWAFEPLARFIVLSGADRGLDRLYHLSELSLFYKVKQHMQLLQCMCEQPTMHASSDAQHRLL